MNPVRAWVILSILSNSSNWTKNSLFSCFSDLSDYLNSLNLVNFLSIRENSNDCSVNEDLLLQLALGFNCHHCLGSYFLPLLKKRRNLPYYSKASVSLNCRIKGTGSLYLCGPMYQNKCGHALIRAKPD